MGAVSKGTLESLHPFLQRLDSFDVVYQTKS